MGYPGRDSACIATLLINVSLNWVARSSRPAGPVRRCSGGLLLLWGSSLRLAFSPLSAFWLGCCFCLSLLPVWCFCLGCLLLLVLAAFFGAPSPSWAVDPSSLVGLYCTSKSLNSIPTCVCHLCWPFPWRGN